MRGVAERPGARGGEMMRFWAMMVDVGQKEVGEVHMGHKEGRGDYVSLRFLAWATSFGVGEIGKGCKCSRVGLFQAF